MAASMRNVKFLITNTGQIQIRRTLLSYTTCCSIRKRQVLSPVVSHGSNHKKFLSDLPTPQLDNEPKQYPEHIKRIVDDISKLTILEVSDLNQLLKKTLNIEDIPMMAMGAMAGPAATGVEAEEEEKPPEPTEFTVKLTGFDSGSKVKLIKEIKTIIPGLNLVQAKKFVESVPQNVRENTNKEEAESVKKALEAVGGVIEIDP